jgi:probable rRNA maturation factor
MKVQFHNFDFSPAYSARLSQWLLEVAKKHHFEIEQIIYTLCARDKMLVLNQYYLDHNTDTDIITFDYSEKNSVSAEVFISSYMLKVNAKKYNQNTENELIRLFSHGLLHCMGFADKSPADQKEMRLQEEACIQLFHVKPVHYV